MRFAKIGLLTIGSVFFSAGTWAQVQTVAMGGTGQPPYFQGALDKIADALIGDGVKVKMLSSEAKSRNALLDEMTSPGYNELLYITLHNPRDNPNNASRGDIIAECYVGGKKAWEEKSKGPIFLTISREHEINSMLDSIVKKIGKHAGGPCATK